MKQSGRLNKMQLLILLLLIICILTGYSQQGLTLEQAMKVAELNSHSMKKTRLNLLINQENLNAQNAALKSKFSLMLTPVSYSQSRVFNDLISDYNSVKKTQAYGIFTIMQPIVLTDATLSLTNSFGYLDSYSDYATQQKKGFNNDLAIRLDQPLFTYNRTKLQLKELHLALENAQLNYAI